MFRGFIGPMEFGGFTADRVQGLWVIGFRLEGRP